MRKIISNILSCFILNKAKRKAFRKQHTNITLKQLADKIDFQNHKIDNLLTIINAHLDIKKLTPATGYLRIIQTLNFEILCEIDRICRKHKINYWLDSGTLLGAIRHHGFIPWDDDVDIGMLSDDYLKFQEVLKKELDDNFFFKKIPSHIGKILHKDFKPETNAEWLAFVNWEKQKRFFFATDIFPFYFLKEDLSTIEAKKIIQQGYNKKREAYNKIEQKYEKLNFVEDILNNSQKDLVSSSKTSRVFLGLETIARAPRIFNICDIFPLKETNFEGHSFFIPNQPHKILYEYYGDFHQIEVFSPHLSFATLEETDLKNLLKFQTIEEKKEENDNKK